MTCYSRMGLLVTLVHDLKVDARQRGDPAYAERCRADIRTVFKNRHTTRLDRYGWPVCLKDDTVACPVRTVHAQRQWQCRCGRWNPFGLWYAAHSQEVVTGPCQNCRTEYQFLDYVGTPVEKAA